MVDDADVHHPSFGLIFEPMVRKHLTASATICQLKCSAGRDIGPAADRKNRRAIMGTVSKALELLNLFTRQRPLIGLSDLARLAELNKATCYRLVTELCDFGLVEQVGSAREYRLGPAVLRLAALREAQVPTREAAMPVLQALAQKTGETAHLSMLMGGALHTLGFAYATTHMTRVTMEDAEVLPFHATSSGLVVLAFQPEAFREAVLVQYPRAGSWTIAFVTGRPTGEVADKLITEIDAKPLVVSADRTPVTQGVMYTALAQAMYSDALWPQLERALSDAVDGDGAGLLQLYDDYFQRKPDGSYGNELEAFLAISCLDDPEGSTVADVDADVARFAAAAKRLGENFGYGYACALWPHRVAERVVVTGKGAGPIVVIGTTGDAATPLASTRKAAKNLEQGVLVIVEADRHTGYGLNSCVVQNVDAYLISLKAPKNETYCK